MSACISREGEYSSHVLAGDGTAEECFVCARCGALDDYGLLAEVDRLTAENDELEKRIDRAGDSLDSLSLDLEEALADRDAAEARAVNTEPPSDAAKNLPDFPVDDGTLNVLYDSMNRTVIGFTDSDEPIYSDESSPFSLGEVLDMLSGYDPALTVQAVNEYDQPIPDIYEYQGGPIYHLHDMVRALIAEIRRLRSGVGQ